MINWKVVCCLAICAIAALSPAPILDRSAKPHSLPIMTPQQQAAGQVYNGRVGQVGTVLRRTNEDGTGPALPESSAAAASNLAASSPEAQVLAAKNLHRAQAELKLDHQGGGISPMVVIIALLAVIGGAMYAGKAYLDKHGPAPKSFNPAERLTKTQ